MSKIGNALAFLDVSNCGKLQYACSEYIRLVKEMSDLLPNGIGGSLYGMDKLRTEEHVALVRLFGLTTEETKHITDNLDKINFDGGLLFDALIDLRNKKEAADAE